MEGRLPCRRIRFRVPKGIRSRLNEVESPIAFKNLTDDQIALYWIDYQGKPQLYAELNPVNRSEEGFVLKTFMTHPWVAVYKRKLQALLNGRKYFHPPNPETWKHNSTSGKNSKWNETPNDVEDSHDTPDKEQFFEVLIQEPGKFKVSFLNIIHPALIVTLCGVTENLNELFCIHIVVVIRSIS